MKKAMFVASLLMSSNGFAGDTCIVKVREKAEAVPLCSSQIALEQFDKNVLSNVRSNFAAQTPITNKDLEANQVFRMQLINEAESVGWKLLSTQTLSRDEDYRYELIFRKP